MDKHPVTLSAGLPARKTLADLLLELNQPDTALKEYREILRTGPNRFAASSARSAPPSSRATPARPTTPVKSWWL
jgi:hypothetical protein